MEFLLECVGFPPDTDLEELAAHVERHGEPAPWRGPAGKHLVLPLAGGVELALDQEAGQDFRTVMPQCRVPHRLRVAVIEIVKVPDSPFDALLLGRANPAAPLGPPASESGEFPIAAHLIDRRKLPGAVPEGHVLALGLAGFALDVSFVGPNDGVRDPAILERPRGAFLQPLGGPQDPGGCMEVSLRVRQVKHVRNPITGALVDVLETDVPGRPLSLFASRWQLEQDGMPPPRPGSRIEGCFLLSGRITGGLPPAPLRAKGAFG